MKKTIINITTATLVTMSLFSCHKKSEDPTPNNVVIPNNNTTTPTTPKDTTKKDSVIVIPIVDTKKLNFTPTNQTIISDGSTNSKGFSLVPMIESDSIYTVEVVSTSTELKVEVNPNKQLVFTAPNNVYSGTTLLTITLKSGKRTNTKQMSVSYGNSKQITTYEMLKPFFGKLLGGTTDNFYINNNGTINSNANGDFYGDNGVLTYHTYTINDNGNIYFNDHGANMEYKVEIITISSKNNLKFTNMVSGTIYKQWLM